MAEVALALLEPEVDRDHVDLAYPLAAVGVSWMQQHKPKLAVPLLERALKILQTWNQEATRLGDTRFALARALWDEGRALRRARTLAEEARRDYQKEPSATKQLADVEAWIATSQVHPRTELVR